MMLEDEVELALLAPQPIEFVVVTSPITCTPWICAGHRTRAEMRAVHDAIDSCYASTRD
jgi:hypothetical protein